MLNFNNPNNIPELGNIKNSIRNYKSQFYNKSDIVLPFEEIDISKYLMYTSGQEFIYVADIYQSLLDIHNNIKNYSTLSHQYVSLRDIKSLAPKLQNVCNCLIDFVNKFPELSENVLVKQSFYLLDAIMIEIELIRQNYSIKKKTINRYYFLGMIIFLSLIFIIGIVILLKELKVF